MIIEAGLSADYDIEVQMLENNPSGLDRAEIEGVVGSQYNRLIRQQHDSKAFLSVSGSTTTADRGNKKRRPRNSFEGNCFNCGRKSHRTEDCRSVKKKIEKSGDAPADKKGEGRGESATSVEVRSTLRINTVACAKS